MHAEAGEHVAGEHAGAGGGGVWCKQTCKDSSLDSSAKGHHLIRVHTHIGLLASQLLHQLLYSWDTGGATNQNDLPYSTPN